MPSHNFKNSTSYHRLVLANYQCELDIQNKLLPLIQSALPEHLVRHVLYCVLSKQSVILFTDHASWSSQLRFYQQTILQSLSIQGYYYRQIKIKIMPQQIQQKKVTDKKYPSQASIRAILDIAHNQTDLTLKHALLKLADTFGKQSNR